MTVPKFHDCPWILPKILTNNIQRSISIIPKSSSPLEAIEEGNNTGIEPSANPMIAK